MSVVSDWEDVPLFDVPLGYKRPRPRQTKVSGEPAMRKYGGKPMTCDLCILDLAAGQPKFPMERANTAAHTERDIWYLCSRHKIDVIDHHRRLPQTRG